MGLSFILAALYVKFRDIGHIWDVVMQAMFYATPIIYPITMVVNGGHETIAKIMMLSPVAQSIQDIRHNLIAPDTTITTWSIVGSWWIAILPVVLTVFLLIVGVIYFNKNAKNFAEDL